MSTPNILVSGGGIASSVFSYWLLKGFPKANITVIERAPALRLTGASVDIRSSAVDIIKWMGLEKEIRARSTKEEGIHWVNGKGNTVGTLRATGRTDVQSITSEFEIFRGELAKIFFDQTQDRVKFIFDDYVDKYEQDADSVSVTFAKSKEVKKYDYLVAADGFRSRIRGQMLGTNPKEQIHEEGVHVAYFSIKKDLLDGSRMAKWYNAPGGRAIFLRPDPNPKGITRGNLMCVTTKNDVEGRKKLNETMEKGNEAYRDLMIEVFKNAGWISPEVVEGMKESDDFYCSIFGQIRSPKLQDRRVVLLGDAGYATPGIGTSLAISGAYVLAGELLREPENNPAAFKRYEDMMLPFVKLHQSDDNAMQILNPQSEWGIKLRNAAIGFVTGLRLDRIAMRGAAMLGIAEKKLDLPAYPWPKAD